MNLTCLFFAALLQSVLPHGQNHRDWNSTTVTGERAIGDGVEITWVETHAERNTIDVELSLVCNKPFSDGAVREFPIRDKSVLFTHDPIKVYLRPGTDCYIYIFLMNSCGDVELLYPDPGSPMNKFYRGIEYCLPGRPVQWILDHETGYETLYFLATREKLEDMERILNKLRYAILVLRDKKLPDFRENILKRGITIVKSNMADHDHYRMNQRAILNKILKRYGKVVKQVDIIHR